MTWSRLRWSLYAPVYDPVVRWLGRGRRRALELLAFQPGERVLVVGCGTGLDFAHLPAGVRVTAGDVTPAMVRRARARAAALGLDADVRTLDAQALDLPDASFDAVVLHLLLAVVPDANAAIHEAARVLRPGGRVSVFDKFLPDGAAPSPARRAAGAIVRLLATDVNRQLGPLFATAGLVETHREASYVGGLFVVATARKPA